MRIPIIEKPKKDEMWFGYVRRLAYINGINKMTLFEKIFSLDASVFPTGLNCLSDKQEGFPSTEQIIMMSPILFNKNENSHNKYLEAMLYPPRNSEPRLLGPSIIKVCPECMHEDKHDCGCSYIHVAHNINGVNVCHKHGCGLHFYKISDKRRNEIPLCEQDLSEIKIMDINKEWLLAQKLFLDHAHRPNLIQMICPECKKMYLTTQFLINTYAGCPWCNSKLSDIDIINRRLFMIYHGEYTVEKMKKISNTSVVHIPCGSTKKNLSALLWGKHSKCAACNALTADALNTRLHRKDFLVLPFTEEERSKKLIRIKHLKCNRESHVIASLFMKKPYCPKCESKVKVIDISDYAEGYTVVSEGKNNRSKMIIKHKDCGFAYSVYKNSFLNGRLCPICTPRYDYNMVKTAVEECTCYKAIKGDKRGYVQLQNEKENIGTYPYGKVMNDLINNKCRTLPNIIKRWSLPKTKKRMIYDAIKESTNNKGYWQASDGIDGLTITPAVKNMIQDMVHEKIIERIGIGKYIYLTGETLYDTVD